LCEAVLGLLLLQCLDLIWSMVSTEKAVEELEEIQEPGVFLADDVAFI
jgi:hypothetical protein